MNWNRLFRPTPVVALAALALLAACDNPVDRDDDHIDEVVSVEITDLAGNVIADLHGDHWHGSPLHLHPGDELDVAIHFVAADGDRFQLPHSGAEHTLGVDIADTGILAYTPVGQNGRFTAVGEGETTITVQVMHGSHPDWETNPPLRAEVVDHGDHEADEHEHEHEH